jgi:hypothetical protein
MEHGAVENTWLIPHIQDVLLLLPIFLSKIQHSVITLKNIYKKTRLFSLPSTWSITVYCVYQLHAPAAWPTGKSAPVPIGAIPSLPHTSSWHSAKLIKHRENFIFYPLGRRLSGPQNRSGWCGEKKNLSPPVGNRTPAFQPVACRYTERAIPVPPTPIPVLHQLSTAPWRCAGKRRYSWPRR